MRIIERMIEDNVVSLVLAKKIKESGLIRETLFYWVEVTADRAYINTYDEAFSYFIDNFKLGKIEYHGKTNEELFNEHSCSAFTLTEIITLYNEVCSDNIDALDDISMYARKILAHQKKQTIS